MHHAVQFENLRVGSKKSPAARLRTFRHGLTRRLIRGWTERWTRKRLSFRTLGVEALSAFLFFLFSNRDLTDSVVAFSGLIQSESFFRGGRRIPRTGPTLLVGDRRAGAVVSTRPSLPISRSLRRGPAPIYRYEVLVHVAGTIAVEELPGTAVGATGPGSKDKIAS